MPQPVGCSDQLCLFLDDEPNETAGLFPSTTAPSVAAQTHCDMVCLVPCVQNRIRVWWWRYWIKIDDHGQVISSLDHLHHRPYERLFLTVPVSVPSTALAVVPQNVVIVYPRREHSRKPPIHSLLSNLLMGERETRCLEMFAREIVPGWMTWGNEVLKFGSVVSREKE